MKKALLIGINQYQLPGATLAGCVNDVRAYYNLLVQNYGFPEGSIRRLIDGNATRVGIIAGLQWLVDGSQAGDILVFQYSGHGAQVPDIDGDEADHLDEAICPVDLQDESGVITDDVVKRILDMAPSGCKTYEISDSCHSGSQDRSISSLLNHHQPRTINVPGVNLAHHKKRPKQRPRNVLTLSEHVLLSGCRDDQTSADASFGGVPHGALTYSLMQVLRHNTQITWSDLCRSSVGWLHSQGFEQVPQLSGPEGLLRQPLFT